MHKIIIAILSALLPLGAMAQSYHQGTGDRDFTLSIASGRVEIEDLDGKESIHSFAAAYRLQGLPLDVEVRYSHVDWNPTVVWVDQFGVTVDQDVYHGTIKNIGIGAKLDLSWTCQAACVYLMAGYNTADLTIDENGYSVDADFPHVGIGARYDFSNGLRANVEYYSYRIEEQDGVDFGVATAVQAGIGYRF